MLRCLKLAAWVPFVGLAWYVVGLERNVPFFDEWRFFEFTYALHAGSVGLGDWFAPHNASHVLPVSRAVLAAVALLSHGSPRAQLLVNVGIVVLTFVAIRALQARGPSAGTPAGAWAGLASALLLTSPVLYAAQAWGPAFCHFAVNLGVVTAAWSLASDRGRPRARLAWAAAACAVATFSRSEGLASWLVMLPGVWALAREQRHPTSWLSLWGLGAAACASVVAASMYWLQSDAAAHPLPASLVADLPKAVGVGLGLVALPLAPPFLLEPLLGWPVPRAYMPVGAAVVGVFGVLAWRGVRSRDGEVRRATWPWVSIGGFGLLFALVAARVRLNTLETGFFGDFWPSNFAITASLLPLATAQLLAIAAVRRETEASTSPRAAWTGWLGAIGLALIVVAGLAAVPSALSERTRSRTHARCWELFDHIAAWSTCFLERPGEDVAARWEEIGFRHRRAGVVADARVQPALGAIEAWRPGPGPERPHSVRGWVAVGDDADAFAVWIEVSKWSGLFAPARLTRHAEGRAEWVADLIALEPGTRAVAWRYDARAGRLERMAGEVETPAPARDD